MRFVLKTKTIYIIIDILVRKITTMRKNLSFRAWFYFRQGWSTYFAFILAALNTMVVTYYLAIEKAPTLKYIFPSFITYIAVWMMIGIPLLIVIGYIHYKKSAAYASEADIGTESNPYVYKLQPGHATLVVFPMYLLMTILLVKLSKNEKLTNDELFQIEEIQKNLKILIDGGSIGKISSQK